MTRCSKNPGKDTIGGIVEIRIGKDDVGRLSTQFERDFVEVFSSEFIDSTPTFTTTREGGISRAPFDSFNLGARCGDEPARVHANRNRFQLWLPSSPGWLRQVHGRQVVDRSKFAEEEPEADAAVAFSPGLACTILTADCLPVLFCDR